MLLVRYWCHHYHHKEPPSSAFIIIIIIYYYYYFFIIINEKISVAFSPKTARTRNIQKSDMFGRQRKKQEGQQRHQYEVANKYVFKCRFNLLSYVSLPERYTNKNKREMSEDNWR